MPPPEPPRRRPAWLAPLVVGLAALPVGAALGVGIIGQGEASSSADTVPTSISDTVLPDVTVGPDASGQATGEPESSSMATTTMVPAPELDAAPLAPGSIRVDGETFIETYQCIAFPVSNPVTGTGDAGIRVALHQMQSSTGTRLSLERWRYDVGGAVGVAESSGVPGLASSPTELLEFAVAPVDGVYLVPNDGALRRVELGELTEPATMCSTLVVDSGVEFRTYGLVDACLAPEGSDLAELFTLHDGVTLTRRTVPDSDRFVGELHHPDGTFDVVDGVVGSTERGTVEFSGTLSPGPLSGADSLSFELDSTPPSRSCLPEQVAAFDVS